MVSSGDYVNGRRADCCGVILPRKLLELSADIVGHLHAAAPNARSGHRGWAITSSAEVSSIACGVICRRCVFARTALRNGTHLPHGN